MEWKILLQKNWLEDRLVCALNINYELEFETEDEGEWERDGVFEWFTGISYRFIRNWSAGLEFWNHHKFADATVHEQYVRLKLGFFHRAADFRAGCPTHVCSPITDSR